jgi:peptidoglycan hydrolase-like protein with peptidoglycan-binding domain
MKSQSITIIIAAALSCAALSGAHAATKAAVQPGAAPQPQQAGPGTPEAPAELSKGERMLRAQVLLERSHYSPGEIDGAFGANMRQALAGFQKAHALPASGTLDQATWNALNADNAPTLVPYTLVEADVAGPFVPIPDDMQAKAALPALGFATPLEGLGEKFHASPALLERLNPGKDYGRAG